MGRWKSVIDACFGRNPGPGEAAVYVLCHKDVGPYYVGSTTNPLQRRFGAHPHRLHYGPGAVLVVIEVVPVAERFAAEAELYDQLIANGEKLVNHHRPKG